MQEAGKGCPICRERALPREHNVAFPFCSPRCKLADLHRWLNGSYAVPGEPALDGGQGHDDPAEDGS